MTSSAKIIPGLILVTGISEPTGCHVTDQKTTTRPNILFCISDDQSFPLAEFPHRTQHLATRGGSQPCTLLYHI